MYHHITNHIYTYQHLCCSHIRFMIKLNESHYQDGQQSIHQWYNTSTCNTYHTMQNNEVYERKHMSQMHLPSTWGHDLTQWQIDEMRKEINLYKWHTGHYLPTKDQLRITGQIWIKYMKLLSSESFLALVKNSQGTRNLCT